MISPQLNAYTAKVAGEFAGQAEAHAAACFAIDDNASSKPALGYHPAACRTPPMPEVLVARPSESTTRRARRPGSLRYSRAITS